MRRLDIGDIVYRKSDGKKYIVDDSGIETHDYNRAIVVYYCYPLSANGTWQYRHNSCVGFTRSQITTVKPK